MTLNIDYYEPPPIKSIIIRGAAGWSVRFQRDGDMIHIGTMRDGAFASKEFHSGPSVEAHDLEDAIELMQSEGWIV